MTCFGQVSKCLACCRLLFCFCCDYEKDTPEVALWFQEEDETPSQTGVKWSLQPTYTHMINPDKKSWAWSRAAAAAAAAAAKSLQPCSTLCDPVDGSPPGSSVPGILQARTLEWVAISFSNAWKWKVKVKSLNHVQLLATPWTVAHQAPPSMGFSRQEYWNGLPFPSPQIHWFPVNLQTCKLW